MRLLIKQRVFSWTDSYDIYDEAGNTKYFVKAEFFALGHQLHVYDVQGKEIGVVKERLLILSLAELCAEAFRSNFRFLSQNMRSILTGGVQRVIS